MNRSTLRMAIVVLTLITAGVHFYLNIPMGGFDPVFTLNGLGYVALLVVFLNLVPLPFLKGREALVPYAYMGYTAVTILAWVILGDKSFNAIGILGYTTKVVEALLMLAVWQYSRAA